VKRFALPAAAGLMVAVCVLALLAWRAWNTGVTAGAVADGTVQVRVAPGASLHSVSADLQRRGLLRQRRLLLLVAQLTGRDRQLQVGRYEIPPSASPRELLRILRSGSPLPVKITLPEGLEVEALAAILADSLALAPAAILAAADSLVARDAAALMGGDARDRFVALTAAGARPDGRRVHWCEGYLAPDTYHFAEGTSAAAVAGALVALQRARLDSAVALAYGPAASLWPHELLTLAAIVESEARRSDERGRIAAVYHNRLTAGRRLEADPTVAFWLGKRGQRLLYRDLEVDSPYNTYLRSGLPAGPIGAPGRAAIMATAQPDTTCRALFFVADGEGGHVFSRTLAEHQQAVVRYRQLMRERRR